MIVFLVNSRNIHVLQEIYFPVQLVGLEGVNTLVRIQIPIILIKKKQKKT